eukprot:TRINITY_DN1076_c0_g1_i1.p1 TRINITY_DN1076_c0_g1~~TRINITY_DN1076_c0_g1_i1.p1  ORF type:complete len:476 (+),score=125.68 TRINITY_DN1076_c0_g1_i1:164-1591(+)
MTSTYQQVGPGQVPHHEVRVNHDYAEELPLVAVTSDKDEVSPYSVFSAASIVVTLTCIVVAAFGTFACAYDNVTDADGNFTIFSTWTVWQWVGHVVAFFPLLFLQLILGTHMRDHIRAWLLRHFSSETTASLRPLPWALVIVVCWFFPGIVVPFFNPLVCVYIFFISFGFLAAAQQQQALVGANDGNNNSNSNNNNNSNNSNNKNTTQQQVQGHTPMTYPHWFSDVRIFIFDSFRGDTPSSSSFTPLVSAPTAPSPLHLNWIDGVMWMLLWINLDLRWFESLWISPTSVSYDWFAAMFSVLLVFGFGALAYRPTFPSFGYRLVPHWRDIIIAICSLAVVLVVVVPIGILTGFLSKPTHWPPLLGFAATWFEIFFTVALTEELFFRVILFNGLHNLLKRRFPRAAVWIAMPLAASAFGLMHWPRMSGLTNQITYVIFAFFVGNVLSFAYLLSGNNIIAGAMCHASIDTVWQWFLGQ